MAFSIWWSIFLTTDEQWRGFIHENFPPQGTARKAHEGSQSSSPRDANQPMDLNKPKTILPGEPGSTSEGFRGRAPD
jgi:hypothetical protein